MKPEPNIPDDLRPLRLVPGYLISADGRVFRAKDCKAVKSLTLKEARREATAAIEFDAKRVNREPTDQKARERLAALKRILLEVGFVPQELESLVYDDCDGNRMVQWLRLPSKAEREPHYRSEAFIVSHAAFSGGPMFAAGNTEVGWYLLEQDGALILFHGPSRAASECI
jgi:hypothetical protein